MTDREQRVWEVLEACDGKQNAVSRAYLRERLKPLTDRAIRETIHDLVTIHRKAIVGSERGGYYVVSQPAEARAAIGVLDSRITQLAERRRALAPLVGPAEQVSLL